MRKTTKRMLALLLCLILMCPAVSAGQVASAEDDEPVYTSGIWTYELVEDDYGTEYAILVDCSGAVDGKVEIPDTIDGYPMLYFSPEIFAGISDMEVVIPSSFPARMVDAMFEGRDWTDIFSKEELYYETIMMFFFTCAANKFTVQPGNTFLCAEDGVLYDVDKTMLIKYPIYKAAAEYTLPSTVPLYMKVDKDYIPGFEAFVVFDYEGDFIRTQSDLTVHISDAQMQALYDARKRIALAMDIDSPDEAFCMVLASFSMGASAIATDWTVPIEMAILWAESKKDLNEDPEYENLVPSLKYSKTDMHTSITANTIQHKEDAKIENKSLPKGYTAVYTSADPKVVTVDEKGNITTHKHGKTEIKVTLVDENGNTVVDGDGKAFEESVPVKVKFAWWQWIVWTVLFGFVWYK